MAGRFVPSVLAALALATASGCAAHPADSPPPQQARSILASSSPAAGATVQGPVESLKLHFDPPARLDEVTVTGPDGTMAMMVHAVAEAADYDLPLSGLESGSYTVEWKSTSRGSKQEGSFQFIVR